MKTEIELDEIFYRDLEKQLGIVTEEEKDLLHQRVKENIHQLAHTDVSQIKQLIQKFSFSSEQEREDTLKQLEVVSNILLFNEQGADIPLEKLQLKAIHTFLGQLEYYAKQPSVKEKEMESEQFTKIDVLPIFQKFGYDFTLLKIEDQEAILRTGQLKKMEEVFQSLQEMQFPKMDEQEKSFVLTSLLLFSSKEIIVENTQLALSKGLTPLHLLDSSASLIPASNSISTFVFGAAEDFKKNLFLLEERGLSIPFISSKCKNLFSFSNELLENNLDLFSEYCFSFDNQKNKIVDHALASLLSTRFAEIADQFIEIHPLGIQYLRDNLSNLKTRSSADDIIFYNIYQSLHGSNEGMAFRQIQDQDSTSLLLRGNITRLAAKYQNQPYCGITDDNKREITDTILPSFKNKEEYDIIMEKCGNQRIDDSIFDNLYVQKIDQYTDSNEPLAYNFDGIRISKLKVLRVYQTLLKQEIEETPDSFLYAISYHTIINQKDFDKLSTIVVNAIQGEGNKK